MALSKYRLWQARNAFAPASIVLAAISLAIIVSQSHLPLGIYARFLPRSTNYTDLSRRLAGSTVHLAITAFFAEVALALLGAQIIGLNGNTRRLRVVLSGARAWLLSLFTCLIVAITAEIANLILDQNMAVGLATLTALPWAIAALVASVLALLVEQKLMLDSYVLCGRLARAVTPRAVKRFGFVRMPISVSHEEDESMAILRYNLDFSQHDPLGPMSDLFWQGVRERDRVLMQAVADSVAHQACRTAWLRYKRLAFSDMSCLQPPKHPHPIIFARKWRSSRSLPVLLFCIHYLVRHGPNAVRELGMESARDAWLLSLLRLLISFARGSCFGAHVRLLVSAIMASAVPVQKLDERSDQHAVQLLPTVAVYMAGVGFREEADDLAMLCGYLKFGRRLPLELESLSPNLRNTALAVHATIELNPLWMPTPRFKNRWVSMVAELARRSLPNDFTPASVVRQRPSFWKGIVRHIGTFRLWRS